jgi:hypothetical protein
MPWGAWTLGPALLAPEPAGRPPCPITNAVNAKQPAKMIAATTDINFIDLPFLVVAFVEVLQRLVK